MNPGTYYARLFIDRNGNGKYDTGNYSEKRQPEEVSYYPQELELKAKMCIRDRYSTNMLQRLTITKFYTTFVDRNALVVQWIERKFPKL